MNDSVLEPWPRRQPKLDIGDALEARADSLTLERIALKKGIVLTSTPNLNGLTDAFAKFTQRVEDAALGLVKRMDSVAGTTENAVTKFGGAVDKVAETAKQIDDAANQLTNGAPVGNS